MREKVKISWIDYKWWFIFAVCTVFLAIRVGERIQSFYHLSDNLFIRGGFFFLILLSYALVALIIFLFCRRIGIIKSRAFHILCEMVLWLVLIELFVLRYLFPANVNNNNLLLLRSSMISLDNEKIFFEGASSLYVDVLSLMFAFLGNHEVLVYYLQFILHILTVIILFFAVRLLVGTISAYVTAIVLALSLSFGEAIILYQPEVVYLFLWSAVLLILAVSYRVGSDIEFSNRASYFIQIVIGFVTGIALYYDFVGILLVVLGFYILFLNRCDMVAYIFKNFFFVLGIMIGFFVMLFREAVIKSNIILENLLDWVNRLAIDFSLSVIIPKENLPIMITFSMFSIFLVVFFLQNTNKGLAVFTFFIIALCVVFPMLGFKGVNLNMWITFVWAAMAGLGLQSLMGYGFRMKIEKDVEEADAVMVDDDVVEEKVPLNEEEVRLAVSVDVKVEVLDVRDEVVDAVTAEIVEEVMVEIAPEVIDVVDGEASLDVVVIEEKPDEMVHEVVSRYDTSTGIKYLDNPLPLPPVPKRRIMDYPYKVSNDKMFYDVEVPDDDDYDIK